MHRGFYDPAVVKVEKTHEQGRLEDRMSRCNERLHLGADHSRHRFAQKIADRYGRMIEKGAGLDA